MSRSENSNLTIALRIGLAIGVITLAGSRVCAQEAASGDDTQSQGWAIHGQTTLVDQGHDSFPSPYEGANSLYPKASGRETFDATLYIGVRLWAGAEAWVNPEVDQGFGLSNTEGVAGFPNGEGAKVGKATPYVRMQRLFLRQTIDLSGDVKKVDPDQNQLGGQQKENRLVFTVGKLNVTDIFDTNDYAHDSKHDFLNWALIDTGTFDYAADAWGYTVGAAAEWYQGDWTLRTGIFDLSEFPNSAHLDPNFSQFQLEAELERRYKLAGKDGAARITTFLSRGRMATYADALAWAAETHEIPSLPIVRGYRSRGGVSINVQQAITEELGVFLRAGTAGGSVEPYEYADIDRTVAAGLSLKGKAWGQADDTVGLAGIVNGISRLHQEYLAAGGLGILVGDGALPHPGSENILETYYDHALVKWLHVALDYQFVDNPAYNRDRGPVSIGSVRLHAQF